MLEIIKEIPEKLKRIIDGTNFKVIYKTEAMFDKNERDYLVIYEEEEHDDEIECYGYVYNGVEPAFSEFGSFGLNKSRTKRIW